MWVAFSYTLIFREFRYYKSNSIENQKELIQRYISCKESLQNVPVMDFVDDGYTGSNFDRPGFQQMMDGVRNGKIDTIIVKDLSRFGRDYIGVGEYMEQIFPLLGVRLIAINDNYDSNNYKGTTLGMDVIVSNGTYKIGRRTDSEIGGDSSCGDYRF